MRGWIRNILAKKSGPVARPCQQHRRRLALECLEDRCVPAGNVLQTNLVSDLPGVAQLQDPHLVNPWGISESTGSPFWVSDNGTGVSTLYNAPANPAAGQPAFSPNPLVVSIPTPDDPLGASGTPTGTVFNIAGGAAGGFKISGVDKTGAATSAPAVFLFATEDGTIVGWNPGVNPSGFDTAKAGTYGIIAPVKNADGSVYKGLAIATDTTGTTNVTRLYAANFHNGTVDVFDTSFGNATLPAGAFTDPNLPKGYAPFNVQELGGKIYVTYAKQDADKEDEVAGPGNGFVDVYNLDGTGEKRLVSRGPLNAPWGLAIAPSSFGPLAGALLVGNFGNGHINAYNTTTGAFLGELKDPDGEPIAIDGLWALKVGNGGNGGRTDTVYFTAGLFDETHGLFGSLAPVAPGTPEGPAEQQMVTAALDVVQLALTQLIQDRASGASKETLAQDRKDLQAAVVNFIRIEVHFLQDVRSDAGVGGHGKGHSHSGDDGGLDRDALFADLGDLFHGFGR